MEYRLIEAYTASSWLRSRQAAKDADAYFRDEILYQLADSRPDTVLQDKKNITAE